MYRLGYLDNDGIKPIYRILEVMNKPISSRFWTWLIRIWCIVPPLIWVPFIVAFFYSPRPSESQPGYWLIVAIIEVLLVIWFVIPMTKRIFTLPSVLNWVYQGMSLLGQVMSLRPKPYLSRADNWDNGVMAVSMFLTLTPFVLFCLVPPRKSNQASQTI